MSLSTHAPAGPAARPESGRPIGSDWVERGLELAERTLDAVIASSDEHTRALGTSVGKVVAETAMLLRILRPHHTGDRFDRLCDRLAGIAVDPRTLAALAIHASASFELAVPYLVLREHRRSAPVDALVAAGFAARAARGRELLPHRRLERLWLLGLLTGRHGITPDDLAQTVLADEIDLLHGSRDDHYAFTHALMYATDFGRRPEGVPAEWVPRLVGQARSALAGALDEDDYDLAGELLLTWPFLRAPGAEVESVALRVLLEVAETVGTLPSLTLGLDAPAGLDPAAATALSTYHTGYVFTALAALSATVTWSAPHGTGRPLRDAWPGHGWRPGWLVVPAASRSADPLPLEASLRRAVREHRFADVAAQLRRPGTLATPTTRQALELLHRLSLL